MPHIDQSVQLDDDVLRCPQCGKRISGEMSTCSACGYELLPHRARMRCRRCGRRIPAASPKCPHCGADPQVGRVPPIVPRIVLSAIVVVLFICVGWVIFRGITTNVLARIVEPTRLPTQVIQVILVVATPVPPSRTIPPSPTPTARVTPSPTRRGARTVTPTAARTIPPPSSSYPAVALLAPAHTTVYNGASAVVVLEWQSVAPNGLRENEWYEIKMTYAARDGKPGERKSYSKETRWTVSKDLNKEVSPDARTLNWSIRVVRVEGIDPLASDNRVYISAGSATRAFIWN